MNKELKDFKKNKIKIIDNKRIKIRHSTNKSSKFQDSDTLTFGKKIDLIETDIIQDISECNAKKEKDIIILIDFNIYHIKVGNLNSKTIKIDAFIEQALVILNNYLSINDRLCLIIYENDFKIICPLMCVNKIDIEHISEDLFHFKNKISKEINESEEYNLNLMELKYNDLEFHLDGKYNNDEYSFENSLEISDNKEKNDDKIYGLIKTINYINNYFKMKENIKNEKYIILFTDMINTEFITDEYFELMKENLNEDKEAIFLLVGKNEKINLKKQKNTDIEILEELILNKFGKKSEAINFENMKKIKTIIMNNKIIKDEIVYPNEIYK
jgi:hypothetical protein